MAKQFFPMLPKLKEASAVNPDKTSVWEDESRDFLNALIKSLAVSGTIKDIGSIDSIPDVWARPLLFQMALFDEQKLDTQQFIKGLHERVRGEWRCLLAMLALKDMKHLDLSAEVVHIGEETSGLGQILLKLAPQESIQESTTTWQDIYVLSYQNIPIAITSPTTLVAAAADYQTAFGGGLMEPWSNDGYTLVDPVQYLTGEDKEALYGWLSKLYDELRNTVPRAEQENSPSCMNILRCLDEYRQDITRRSSHPLRTDVTRRNSELNLNLGIFRLLNQTVQARQASVEDSAVRLMASPERHPKRDLLLVSPDMVRDFAEQLGIPATQLIVWSGMSANDITESELQGERRKLGRISLGNVEWRSPEDFFLDKMTVMEPGNAIVGSRPIAGEKMLAEDETTVILPIRQELLEYFTAQEIAERLSIENNAEDICIYFSFPLSGVGGAQENFKFAKRYPKKDLIYLQTNVPVIEIWPNFRREGWKKYYLYYENSEAQNENNPDLGKDFFYVNPWAYGEDIGADVPNRGLVNRYTAQLTDFPEALLCTVNLSTTGISTQAVEAGILLLAQPPLASRESSLSWQFGIDFGTSSTMLYYREGSNPPHPLSFEPRLFQVTDSGIPRTRTFVNFIPSMKQEQSDGSFLSIFHMLNTENMHQEIRPLQDGHLFMLTTQRIEDFRKQGNRVDANLKWKDDDIGRRKVAAYVKQVCLQSAAEAAARGAEQLNWNFSFPTAFSKEQQFAFKATCQEAVTETYQNTCFASAVDSTIEPWPESKASAYYFNKLGKSDTNFSDGAICLDIGAGTTDISIISGQPGRIVYHTSIQFAGRYLFLPIYLRYDLFSKGARYDRAMVMDDEKVQASIDADMREHSEEYLRNLKNITGREEVKQVLQLSQLAMAGIFYYLGDLLHLLHEQEIYREDHVPDIFVGGNGSRIFTWLTGGVYDSSNPFMDVLKHTITESSGLAQDSRFRIQLSANPKIEVACGMIETRPHNDGEFFDEVRQTRELFGRTVDEYTAASVLAGEGCFTNGEHYDKCALISAQDISSGLRVDRLDELGHFIDFFNGDHHIWSEGIRVDEDQRQDICKLVNSYYVSEKGKDVKKIFVEPVFIIALKKLMEMLANE